jgi:Protein of unknown function (DUF2384)
MTVSTIGHPDVLFTGPGQVVSVPAWARRFSPRTATAKQVRALRRLPRLTIVQAKAPDAVLEHVAFLQSLAAQHERTTGPSKIVFVFEPKTRSAKAQKLAQVLGFFHRVTDVQFARGPEQAAFALEEALAKILTDERQNAPRSSTTDPIGQVKSVVAATSDLRSDSGRLSAQKVAAAFGLSVADLAALVGRKRQAVSKTGDAASLQAVLFPFERIARLRTVLPATDFRRWLNMPSGQLDNRTPLEVIRGGHVGVVADLADDMLTGSPV